MGLFKSKVQRRMERDIKIKQGISQINRQIKKLSQDEKNLLDKARKAKQIGSHDQLNFLKQQIRRTIAGRKQLERQSLAIETALQIKNQAESYSAFANSLTAVSKAIADVFGNINMEKTQNEFEHAITKAQSMEERMNVFLDMTYDTMDSMESTGDESMASDDEIDRLIEADSVHKEKAMDDEITQGIKEIEKELGKER